MHGPFSINRDLAVRTHLAQSPPCSYRSLDGKICICHTLSFRRLVLNSIDTRVSWRRQGGRCYHCLGSECSNASCLQVSRTHQTPKPCILLLLSQCKQVLCIDRHSPSEPWIWLKTSSILLPKPSSYIL